MILVNKLSEQEIINQTSYSQLLIILSPFSPYLSQEIWTIIGNDGFVSQQPWPNIEPIDFHEDMTTLVVQFSGKTRGTIDLPIDYNQDQVIQAIRQVDNLARYYPDQLLPKKIIFLPGKLINLVF